MSRPRLLAPPKNGHDDHTDPLVMIDLPERVDAVAEEVTGIQGRDESRLRVDQRLS